jgi:hypothetical protein
LNPNFVKLNNARFSLCFKWNNLWKDWACSQPKFAVNHNCWPTRLLQLYSLCKQVQTLEIAGDLGGAIKFSLCFISAKKAEIVSSGIVISYSSSEYIPSAHLFFLACKALILVSRFLNFTSLPKGKTYYFLMVSRQFSRINLSLYLWQRIGGAI